MKFLFPIALAVVCAALLQFLYHRYISVSKTDSWIALILNGGIGAFVFSLFL